MASRLPFFLVLAGCSLINSYPELGGAGGGGTGGEGSLEDGEPCGTATECASGICSDGVCCATACDAACESCNLEAAAGVCTPMAADTDPEGECPGSACSGDSTCRGQITQALAVGGDGDEIALDVGSAANDYLVGSTTAGFPFGPGTIASPNGDENVFALAYDAAFEPLWAQGQVGGHAGAQRMVAVAVGSARIYVAGEFAGTIELAPGNSLTAFGGQDVFVAAYQHNGSLAWVERYGGPFDDRVHDVSVGPPGVDDYQLSLVGSFEGSFCYDDDDCASYTITSHGGRDGYFIAIDASDGIGWDGRALGGAGDDEATATAVVDDGRFWEAWVAGYVVDSGDIGDGGSAGLGNVDGFLSRLDEFGEHLASVRIGEVGATVLPSALALDASSWPALGGVFAGGFTSGNAVTAAGTDHFVSLFDGNAVGLTSFAFGSDNATQGRLVLTRAADDVVIAATLAGTTTIEGTPFTSQGDDVLVATFASDGALEWARLLGDASDQRVGGVTIAQDGSVLVSGGFRGELGGDGQVVTATGEDAFLLRIVP